MINIRIMSITLQYMSPFEGMQANELKHLVSK